MSLFLLKFIRYFSLLTLGFSLFTDREWADVRDSLVGPEEVKDPCEEYDAASEFISWVLKGGPLRLFLLLNRCVLLFFHLYARPNRNAVLSWIHFLSLELIRFLLSFSKTSCSSRSLSSYCSADLTDFVRSTRY